MAHPEETHDAEIYAALMAQETAGWEWSTVAEETPVRVMMDAPGEVFIGQYKGEEEIVPENGRDEPFSLYVFVGLDGKRYALNKSYKLERAMGKVNVDDWTRVELVKMIEVSKGNPLKDYRVDVRRK